MKIWSKKTNYFLFRINAWAGIAVLVLATTIHWDEFIAGYNLKRRNTVELDVPFLLSLSDKALPLLDTNIVVLQNLENKLKTDAEKTGNVYKCDNRKASNSTVLMASFSFQKTRLNRTAPAVTRMTFVISLFIVGLISGEGFFITIVLFRIKIASPFKY